MKISPTNLDSTSSGNNTSPPSPLHHFPPGPLTHCHLKTSSHSPQILPPATWPVRQKSPISSLGELCRLPFPCHAHHQLRLPPFSTNLLHPQALLLLPLLMTPMPHLDNPRPRPVLCRLQHFIPYSPLLLCHQRHILQRGGLHIPEEGTRRAHLHVLLLDLPGTYSNSPPSLSRL